MLHSSDWGCGCWVASCGVYPQRLRTYSELRVCSIVPVQYSEARSPRMNFDVPVLTINLRFTNDWLEITYDCFPIVKHHNWESWVAVIEYT